MLEIALTRLQEIRDRSEYVPKAEVSRIADMALKEIFSANEVVNEFDCSKCGARVSITGVICVPCTKNKNQGNRPPNCS